MGHVQFHAVEPRFHSSRGGLGKSFYQGLDLGDAQFAGYLTIETGYRGGADRLGSGDGRHAHCAYVRQLDKHRRTYLVNGYGEPSQAGNLVVIPDT